MLKMTRPDILPRHVPTLNRARLFARARIHHRALPVIHRGSKEKKGYKQREIHSPDWLLDTVRLSSRWMASESTLCINETGRFNHESNLSARRRVPGGSS